MPNRVEDYYKILGVTKDATDKDIQRAYRKLAHKYHPDSNDSKEAEEKFKKISEAYNVLKDPEKRKAYDQFGHNWEQGKGFYSQDTSSWAGNEDILKSVFESIFRTNGFAADDLKGFGGFNSFRGFSSNMGGYGKRTAFKGENVEAEIEISISDSYYGATKKINIGDENGNRKRLDIKIPRGITHGQKIRLKGQGKTGYNGGVKGDLLIKVNIMNDMEYNIQGSDIYKELKLTPWEVAFGAEIEAKAFDKTIRIKIPKGTQSGKKFRLKGKGLQGKKMGDFYFVANIVVPDKLSRQEKDLLKKWQQISTFNPRS